MTVLVMLEPSHQLFYSPILMIFRRIPYWMHGIHFQGIYDRCKYSTPGMEIISSFPLYDYRYPVYAATIQVSGSGTKTLPDFHSPVSDIYWIAITYQGHLPINSFRNLTLRWTNPEDSESWSDNLHDVAELDGGNFEGSYSDFSAVNYSMTLAYNYSGQDVEALQIRIYSQTSSDNWLPCSD
ncbi:Protein CBG21385 [Caenorhabditis briggsae]|uniref:Protein CBG21385 n=1 Tax=Caenorhabditis briggsae TaxID=6238 RepID=A8XZY9_CAEBR|nr:Protein CBG21385 [Caenorhabditis briggsae]CAP38206.2 Protein CBG21385 [Caenorhabditis briggsae]